MTTETTKMHKAALSKVQTMLAAIVGVQPVVKMVSLDTFIAHAMKEIDKAQHEPIDKSRARLLALHKSVMYSSALIEDVDSDSIKVPIFQVDQTALDEQSNTVQTPQAAAALNPAAQTVFENGMGGLAKMLTDMQKQVEDGIDVLRKLGEDIEEDDDAMKAKAKKAEEDGGDEAEKAKAKKTEDEEENRKTTEKRGGGEVWPDDMNDPTFVQKGMLPDLDWGRDHQKP